MISLYSISFSSCLRLQCPHLLHCHYAEVSAIVSQSNALPTPSILSSMSKHIAEVKIEKLSRVASSDLPPSPHSYRVPSTSVTVTFYNYGYNLSDTIVSSSLLIPPRSPAFVSYWTIDNVSRSVSLQMKLTLTSTSPRRPKWSLALATKTQ